MGKEFIEPTYEEYKKATSWARFKYKYGIVVMILCWLALIFVIIYMVSNGEAIARNPLIYGCDKYDVTCTCYNKEGVFVYVNGSYLISEKRIERQFITDNEKLKDLNISFEN